MSYNNEDENDERLEYEKVFNFLDKIKEKKYLQVMQYWDWGL